MTESPTAVIGMSAKSVLEAAPAPAPGGALGPEASDLAGSDFSGSDVVGGDVAGSDVGGGEAAGLAEGDWAGSNGRSPMPAVPSRALSRDGACAVINGMAMKTPTR